MTREYLLPADVDPDDAARVLERLNAMQSAEELAMAFDFPDELDIGVRLAARILTRRDELGGFTSLEQVDAVPLIGPERFTELVLGLLGRPLPWAVPRDDGLDALRAELAALRAQLAALRAEVASGALPAGGAPALRVVPAGPWLGQPVTVSLAVQAAGGRVLVGASNGRLRTAAGGAVEEGASVVVSTDTGGRATLEWRAGARVLLTPEQRAALGSHLPVLGDAATPAGAAEGLRALAAAYDEQPNRALREAVDALAATPERSVPDPRGGWPAADVTLTAVALAGGAEPGLDAVAAPAAGGVVEGRPAAGTAVAGFALRDWLPAFEEALAAHLAETSPLPSQLPVVAAGLAGVAAGAAVQQRLADYVTRRPGELGQRAAREVAHEALQGLLKQTTMADLREREALVPLLAATARVVEAAPTSVLRVVEATSQSLLRDVEVRVPPGTLEAVADRVQQVEQVVEQRVAQLQLQLDQKVDQGQMIGQIGDLLGKLDQIEDRLRGFE